MAVIQPHTEHSRRWDGNGGLQGDCSTAIYRTKAAGEQGGLEALLTLEREKSLPFPSLNQIFALPLQNKVRPEVAEAIIQPSEEVSESAVPSAVA